MAMPSHQPTSETKEVVKALKSFGNNHPAIARHIGISEETLEKHYRHELDTAVVDSNAKVASTLFKKATVDEDVTSIIFWLKCRDKWRTSDIKAIIESNEAMKEEFRLLKAKLDEQNRKDY